MENVRDWCISRQLWWGHRIPAYYCDDCGEMVVAKEDVTVCPKCGSTNMHQDEDVLDTWFSSALWPFSTLGWPENTELLKNFYPTSLLVTAYDIIFFWVARMIFSGMEHMGKEPFSHVLIHGLVRDSQGRKMSKSLNNGIDPLEVIDKYGADALRFTLATGNSPGNDMRFYWERVEASRNFGNKIWNAARFALMNLTIDTCELPKTTDIADRWILSKYNRLASEVTDNLDRYELGIAVSKLYDFIWDDLCDWYIELIKPRLFDTENKESNVAAQQTLCYVFTGVMKLLHPFMPFITEEIYQTLPHDSESIVIAPWPKAVDELNDLQAEREMERIMDAIKAIRNRRSEMNVPPSRKTEIYIATEYPESFTAGSIFFEKLASASKVTVGAEQNVENAVVLVTDGAKVYLPLAQLVDFEQEKKRLLKEKKKLEDEIERATKKLSNEGFLAKAPQSLIDEEKEKLAKYTQMLDIILSIYVYCSLIPQITQIQIGVTADTCDAAFGGILPKIDLARISRCRIILRQPDLV